MSNHLAIATVTATLRRTLQALVPLDVAGANVTALRPDASNAASLPDPGVNLYLYQVTPNVAWRNMDLPTRSSGGHLVKRPRIALDLHYLFTFYGDDLQLEPQRVLASVVRIMHARPALTRTAIENTIADPAFNTFLAGSDLAEEVETVKFTAIPFSLEELSKLWSVLLQTPYALTMAYMGTVVLIEPMDAPRRVLPVRVRNVTALPFRRAYIEAAEAEGGATAPVVIDETLVLRGQQLGGTVTGVRFAEAVVMPGAVTNTEIRIVLTDAALRAGIQGVQVLYADGGTSNVAPLVLRPRITRDGGGNYEIRIVTLATTTFLRVTLRPIVGHQQHVQVHLNGLAPAPGPDTAYSLPAVQRATDTDTITVDLSDVAAGDYLVRVEVAGAESMLDFDAITGVYNAPSVTLP